MTPHQQSGTQSCGKRDGQSPRHRRPCQPARPARVRETVGLPLCGAGEHGIADIGTELEPVGFRYLISIHCRNCQFRMQILSGYECFSASRTGPQMRLPLSRQFVPLDQVDEVCSFEMSPHHRTQLPAVRCFGSFTSFLSFSRAKNTLALMVEIERPDMDAISS